MNVKELIEKLKQYPDDYIVTLLGDDDFYFHISEVSVHEDKVLLIADSELCEFSQTDPPRESEYVSDPQAIASKYEYLQIHESRN